MQYLKEGKIQTTEEREKKTHIKLTRIIIYSSCSEHCQLERNRIVLLLFGHYFHIKLSR